MSFRRFEYFLVVAEELNFQRAAQRLFISQQALSAHIQKLEEAYGVTLFERRPRLRLTLAGEHMVLHCKRLMEVDTMMNSDLSELNRYSSGKIILGLAQLRAQIFMPRIWERFNRLYPNISLVVKDASGATMENQLIQGEIDLFVGVNSSRSAPLQYCSLVTEPLCCVVHKSVLRQYGVTDIDGLIEESKEFFDLKKFLKMANFPYVLLPQSNRLRANIDRYFYETGVTPRIAFESSSNSLIWSMCCRGCGVGFLSPTLLYDSIISGSFDSDICIFPIEEPTLVSNVDIVCLRKRPASRPFQSLVDITQEVFREYAHTVLGQ